MSNLKNLKLIDTIQDIPIHKTSEAATLRKEGLSTKKYSAYRNINYREYNYLY